MKFGMPLYVILTVIGSLLILGATLAKWIHDKAEKERAAEGHEASQAKLLAEYAEATAYKKGYRRLYEDLVRSGRLSASEAQQLAPKESNLAGIQGRIRQAIKEIPEAVKEDHLEHQAALSDELEAQEYAARIDREIRPRLQSVINLLHRVVTEASEQGLVKLLKDPGKFNLPQQTTYTAFILQEKNIPLNDKSTGIRYEFKNKAIWDIYLQYGQVRSPNRLLKKQWTVPTDRYYPMIRIKERTGNTHPHPLAVLWFHQDTGKLLIQFSQRNNYPELAKEIDDLSKTLDDEEFIAAAMVKLLKNTRLASAGSK